MSEDEIKSICSVLAAIYHLGVTGAVKGKVDAILGQDLELHGGDSNVGG